jgi:hypothetical protein
LGARDCQAEAAVMTAEANRQQAVDRRLGAHGRGEDPATADAECRCMREAGDGTGGPKGRKAAKTETEGGITGPADIAR